MQGFDKEDHGMSLSAVSLLIFSKIQTPFNYEKRVVKPGRITPGDSFWNVCLTCVTVSDWKGHESERFQRYLRLVSKVKLSLNTSPRKNNPCSQPDYHWHTKGDIVLKWMDTKVQNIFPFEFCGHGNLINYFLLSSWPQLSISNLLTIMYFLPWCLCSIGRQAGEGFAGVEEGIFCEKEYCQVWKITLFHQFWRSFF